MPIADWLIGCLYFAGVCVVFWFLAELAIEFFVRRK